MRGELAEPGAGGANDKNLWVAVFFSQAHAHNRTRAQRIGQD